jgi:3-dehydroquinate dehydratase/shikimate dehydrogenase
VSLIVRNPNGPYDAGVTHLCVSIPVDAADAVGPALAAAARAAERGATMAEWRVDAMVDALGGPAALPHVRALVRGSPVPSVVTVRGAREGGEWRGGDDERVSFLEALCAASAPGDAPAYVDFELADYARSANVRQKVDLCVSHPGQVRDVGTRLVLSAHGVEGRPADLVRSVAAMGDAPACAVAKVAWTARSVRDCVEAFELLLARPKPMVALCMGEAGVMTRVLAPKFGAFLTFARAGGPGDAHGAAAVAVGTAPGQPTVAELVERYGFGRIGPRTRVFGVVGWPVAHSRGPEVHNAWFRERSQDAVYVPIPVAPGWESFKASMSELVGFAPLDFRGASVTIPHKEHLVRLVREAGGTVDALAARIGAANTLCVAPGGALRCTNTDAPAAVDALVAGMGIERAALRGRRVAVVGAGGVARAVAAGLADEGATVVVFARDPSRARAMCDDLSRGAAAAGCGAIEGKVVAGRSGELGCGCFHAFVNCTPVGMEGGPDPDGNPLEDVALDGSVTVMDTVYAPRETPMLRESRSRGARCIDGLAMFMDQARRQSDLWAGLS